MEKKNRDFLIRNVDPRIEDIIIDLYFFLFNRNLFNIKCESQKINIKSRIGGNQFKKIESIKIIVKNRNINNIYKNIIANK